MFLYKICKLILKNIKNRKVFAGNNKSGETKELT